MDIKSTDVVENESKVRLRLVCRVAIVVFGFGFGDSPAGLRTSHRIISNSWSEKKLVSTSDSRHNPSF